MRLDALFILMEYRAYGEIAFEIFERLLHRHELQIVGPQLGGIVLREIRASRSAVYTDC
jgi:hypothetical protein